MCTITFALDGLKMEEGHARYVFFTNGNKFLDKSCYMFLHTQPLVKAFLGKCMLVP